MSRLLAFTIGLTLALTMPGIAYGADPTRVAPQPAPGHVLMLDTASTPTLTEIQEWQRFSPYQAVAVYIPVAPAYDNRTDKVQAGLDRNWVSSVRGGKWNVAPIYVGLQAPCSTNGRYRKISTNVSTARAQGTSMAKDAATAAFNLGLPVGAPISLNLEGYPSSAACRGPIAAMLDAWTRQLHQLGRNSAVYGSASSTIADLVTASQSESFTKPDAVWVAKWDDNPNTDLAVLPDGLWSGRRAHQFRGDNTDAHETYGSVTLEVDENAVQPGFFSLPKPDIVAPTLAGKTSTIATKARAVLNWKMRDSSGIARYQVQVKTGSRWTSPANLKRTTATSRVVAVSAGAKACARARGTDKVGNTSAWITTCVHRWGTGNVFRGKTWKKSGSTAVSSRPSTATGPRVSGTTFIVETRGRAKGRILLNGRAIATFTGGGKHRVTLSRPRSGRLAVRTTSRGKVVVARYVVTS